jgi:hypothetical protein
MIQGCGVRVEPAASGAIPAGISDQWIVKAGQYCYQCASS